MTSIEGPTKSLDLRGPHEIGAAMTIMVSRSGQFLVTPLPDGMYRLTTKDEGHIEFISSQGITGKTPPLNRTLRDAESARDQAVIALKNADDEIERLDRAEQQSLIENAE